MQGDQGKASLGYKFVGSLLGHTPIFVRNQGKILVPTFYGIDQKARGLILVDIMARFFFATVQKNTGAWKSGTRRFCKFVYEVLKNNISCFTYVSTANIVQVVQGHVSNVGTFLLQWPTREPFESDDSGGRGFTYNYLEWKLEATSGKS